MPITGLLVVLLELEVSWVTIMLPLGKVTVLGTRVGGDVLPLLAKLRMMTSPLGIVVVPLAGRDLSLLALIVGGGITMIVVCNETAVPVAEEVSLKRLFGGNV